MAATVLIATAAVADGSPATAVELVLTPPFRGVEVFVQTAAAVPTANNLLIEARYSIDGTIFTDWERIASVSLADTTTKVKRIEVLVNQVATKMDVRCVNHTGISVTLNVTALPFA